MWKSDPVNTLPFLAGRGVCFQGLGNFGLVSKQIIGVAMMGIYMLFAAGLAVQGHYCMNRLADVDLLFASHHPADADNSASTTCDGCGMAASLQGCCHDETTMLKIEDEHGFQLTSLKINYLGHLSVAKPAVLPLIEGSQSPIVAPVYLPKRPPLPVRCAPAMLCVFRC